MTEPTTSTRTFVFTDIEGSTRLLRELGHDYRVALREHDRLVSDAAAAHGGEVLGSEGDAQFITFEDAAAAVAAAAAAQRALGAHTWPAGHPLRVRMGIHVGEAQRDAGGFVGLALHETARVCAAAHGSQVLLSSAVAELVRGRLPDGIALRDLGEHELKDIGGPQTSVPAGHRRRVAGLPAASRATGGPHVAADRAYFVHRPRGGPGGGAEPADAPAGAGGRVGGRVTEAAG